jgi:IS30 family transposase
VVEELLVKKWSPEQISGWLHRTGGLSISHETIYRYIWKDKEEAGQFYRHLRGASKLRRKRKNSYDSRGRLVGKRHVPERPASVEARSTLGHWEGDTVVGGGDKDCITTLVERKIGLALIGKIPARSKRATSKRMIKLIQRTPDQFKTIALDNGTEFDDYERIEEKSRVKIYFATPYHSWERGCNKNFNGLVRQYLPKSTSQKHVTQKDCDDIARQLNDRPRKRLGYRTPKECFDEE